MLNTIHSLEEVLQLTRSHKEGYAILFPASNKPAATVSFGLLGNFMCLEPQPKPPFDFPPFIEALEKVISLDLKKPGFIEYLCLDHICLVRAYESQSSPVYYLLEFKEGIIEVRDITGKKEIAAFQVNNEKMKSELLDELRICSRGFELPEFYKYVEEVVNNANLVSKAPNILSAVWINRLEMLESVGIEDEDLQEYIENLGVDADQWLIDEVGAQGDVDWFKIARDNHVNPCVTVIEGISADLRRGRFDDGSGKNQLLKALTKTNYLPEDLVTFLDEEEVSVEDLQKLLTRITKI